MRVLPNSLPTHCPGIPLYWASNFHRIKVFPVLWCQIRHILCYICSWSHVYSLAGDLVLGSSGGVGMGGWLILLFFSSFSLSSNSSIGVPLLNPTVGCKHQNLYLCWRDSSVVKSTDCSSRGPEFNSQQPHGGSQPSVMRSDWPLLVCLKIIAVYSDK